MLTLELLHLVAWGQLGVLIRYYLGRVFGGACEPEGGSWVPCVTSPGLTRPGGTLFTDLPANILGSAIMGLLSPADMLLMRPGAPGAPAAPAAPPPPAQAPQDGAAAEQREAQKQPPPLPAGDAVQAGVPCACLPRDSPLQKHPALLLGLRTGLCGCLTTFASWLNQVVEMTVGTSPAARDAGTEWFEALCALVVGSLAAQAALNFGQQLAFTLAGHWHRRSLLLLQGQPGSQPPPQQAAPPAAAGSVALAVHESAEPRDAGVAAPATGRAQEAGAAAPAVAGAHATVTAAQAVAEAAGDGKAVAAGATGAARDSRICALADAWSVVMLLALNAVSVALIAVVTTADVRSDAPGNEDFSLWVGILLGPIGCLARWQLSTLNTRSAPPPGGSLFPPAWFPLGTWLANMGGCLLDYVMTLLQVRVAELGPNSSGVLSAVALGVGGSLSTVSTWVVELQKLGLQAQANHRAAWYFLGSLAPAVALGLLVYGTAAWTL